MSSLNDKLSDPAYQQKSIEQLEKGQSTPKISKTKILIAKIKRKIGAVKEFADKWNFNNTIDKDGFGSIIDFNGDGPLLADAKKRLKKTNSDLKQKKKKK